VKTAYSYLRFSSPSQGDGDSRRRQLEGTQAWCAKHNYILDDSLRDEGRSAFRGKNATGRRSALASFLFKIEVGLVKPGSVLILENLDRLSRQQIDVSIKLAQRILEAGVSIITLVPERVYSPDCLSQPLTWMELVFHFDRAHAESKLKSGRLKEKWAQRRIAMLEKKVVSRRLPFWISVEDGRFVLNEKVAWVRHAFKMASEGAGLIKIQKHFAQHGWKVRRAATVDRQLIRRLLHNRQVMGEHQPRTFNGSTDLKDRPVSGDPISNYFPEAIKPALFLDVQKKLAERRRQGRGRPANRVANLFTGLMTDLRDGSRVYAILKGGKRYVVSWNAMHGVPGSVYAGFSYNEFERGILRACREIDPDLLTPPSDVDEEIAQAAAELAELALKTERAKDRLKKAKDAETEEIVTEQLADLKKEQRRLEKHLDDLKGRKVTAPAEQMKKVHDLIDMMEQAEDKEKVRTIIRGLIRVLVENIGVYIQRRGHKGRRCWVLVEFKAGLWRKLLLYKGNVVTIADDDPTLNIPEGGGWK
jgi:DNA invertase Pin-like site-specific DNA recombinase/urease gamma subunit